MDIKKINRMKVFIIAFAIIASSGLCLAQTTTNVEGSQFEFKEVVSKESLEGISGILEARNIGGTKWLLSSSSKNDLREDIFKFAVKSKFNVLSLSVDEQKMEDIFHNLTK